MIGQCLLIIWSEGNKSIIIGTAFLFCFILFLSNMHNATLVSKDVYCLLPAGEEAKLPILSNILIFSLNLRVSKEITLKLELERGKGVQNVPLFLC
jgi:hypothetical protein